MRGKPDGKETSKYKEKVTELCVWLHTCCLQEPLLPFLPFFKLMEVFGTFWNVLLALDLKDRAEQDLGGMETLSAPIINQSFPPFMGSVMTGW